MKQSRNIRIPFRNPRWRKMYFLEFREPVISTTAEQRDEAEARFLR